MSSQTKSEIKNRMVKKAAELWGVAPNDIESTFDPIVSLLIGACASELSKIANEVNGSQSRVTEKLIQLMTPETSFGAQPAHAIAHAAPNESSLKILPTHQLYTKKRIKNNDGEAFFKTAYFSPIKTFKLVQTRVKVALYGNQITTFEDTQKIAEKDILSTKNDIPLDQFSVFLGIAPSDHKISLKGASLFFELTDLANQNLFYNQLKQAKFYYNDKLIDVHSGYADNAKEDQLHIRKIFSEQSQKTTSIERQALSIYKKHYISINSDVYLNKTPKKSDFLNHIDLDQHDEIKGLHWIKVVFPTSTTSIMLKNLFVSLNTFPVLNRRLESTTYQLKEFANIVPFSTSDLFLDIRKITNDNNKAYSTSEERDSNKKGTYTLRDESIGRLDHRKAKDYLIHLIDLLKNESASFSALGSDFLQTNINKLNQNIAALEHSITQKSLETENTHYLSIKPYRKKETIFVEFWSTIGENANLIRSNTTLQVYKGTDIDTQKCFLVTATSQGKNILNYEERLYKYRRMLLSRERIVTREDVKALCYDICGKKISKVAIHKTFKVHQEYTKGLIPTLVIELTKNPKIIVEDAEWEMIKDNILFILEEKSVNLLPYTVKIS